MWSRKEELEKELNENKLSGRRQWESIRGTIVKAANLRQWVYQKAKQENGLIWRLVASNSMKRGGTAKLS